MSVNSVVKHIPRTYLFRAPPVSKRLTVAVVAPSYGMERVSYMIPSERHRYVKLGRLPFHKLGRADTVIEQMPVIVGPRVDLVHTFNHLPVNRPFVVTAEMELPRFLEGSHDWQKRLGLRLLNSDRCRGIWPLSNAGRDYITRRFVKEGQGHLAKKVTVFRGAVLFDSPHDVERSDKGPLRILFVGGDGLRKGLRPTLDAVRAIRKGGVELLLTVVGEPRAETYVTPGITVPTQDISAALANEDWIQHYVTLPNAEVRHLMRTHDLFVLPTMDESLGWVFAEAAASGLPSISTNIFAIPELVLDGITGWTIALPLDEDRRWSFIGRAGALQEWTDAQAHITARLIELLAAAAADRSAIAKCGQLARQHIADHYAVEVAGPHLETLYSSATERK